MADELPSHPEHRHRWWRVVAFVALGVVVVGAAGGWFVWARYLRNSSKPVDVAAVEQQYTKGAKTQATRPGHPVPGVYLYRTVGSESVDALGGATNTYPKTTTITVTDTPCGVNTRWNVLVGRFDGDTRCRQRDGTWLLTSTTTSDRFFDQTDADTYACDDVVDLPVDPRQGASWRGSCHDAPASGTPNTTALTYRVVGTQTLQIAGKPVDTVHLRVTSRQGGQRSGGGVEDRWVVPETNLVVRSLNREKDESPSPIGHVTYQQRYDIRLQSLDPRG